MLHLLKSVFKLRYENKNTFQDYNSEIRKQTQLYNWNLVAKKTVAKKKESH